MGIPKKIHYCWFGRGKKSEIIEKCIESWKKYCPDWEIIEWNEDNFDVDFCPYSKKAYHNRKYAFLSDVARLKIIYDNGGVYMDTDVELLHPIDELLEHDAWFGYMRSTHADKTTFIEVNTGSGFGAVRHNDFVKKLLDQYLSFDEHTDFQICNRIDTEVFKKEWPGFIFNEFVRQQYDNMVIIENGWKYLFHYCENSWQPWHKKIRTKIAMKIKGLLRK